MRRLRIVQVISNYPDARPLPPTNQGGTEKVVHELTENLVRRGHDVYLFASRGSRSSAKLIPYKKNLRDRGIARFVLKRMPRHVDIIHDHTFTSTLGRRKLKIPTICTLHLPVKQRVKHPVYVSRRARTIMGKNRGYFVYNGISPRDYQFSKEKKGFLLFIGRLIPEKGVLEAIKIAERTGHRLLIAGPIKDRRYFNKLLAPRIKRNPRIRYVGAVGGRKKQYLLKNASCLLFPTLWEEPFGLVMIEAMACGTPVVALRRGRFPKLCLAFRI
ncbi:glycosyltransferase [Paenibacillus hexagrammi]|uniref:Glycosyltransferase n=1 Tax=Paenibacillus hexagrammi TaxID=2908839 RepID=A0ABY3SLR9_9BACL|nr:glycosyltransferase [Paenibacillus sp. YPD9-1]UJF35003.1 glycosyltransferase [Paenibacillus sp. YPD9-1]